MAQPTTTTGIEAMTILLVSQEQPTTLIRAYTRLCAVSVKLSNASSAVDRKCSRLLPTGIDNANRQAEHFSGPRQCIANLASLYQQTLANCASAFRSKAMPFICSKPRLLNGSAVCCFPLSEVPFYGVSWEAKSII